MAKPLTARQRFILEYMGKGMVLRRPKGLRAYRLFYPGTHTHLSYDPGVSADQATRLAAHFDAYDAATGELLPRVSLYGARLVELRLKPADGDANG